MTEETLKKELDDINKSLQIGEDEEIDDYELRKKPLLARMKEVTALLRPLINIRKAKEVISAENEAIILKKQQKKEEVMKEATKIQEKTELTLLNFEKQAEIILNRYKDPESIIDLYIVPEARTVQTKLELALILQKLENQKSTLINLINKRKALDKKTMEENKGKGITDYDRIASLYDVKALKKFLFDEQMEVDSDDDKMQFLESSDDDMPRITDITLPDGTSDVKIEPYMSYISRLRARAVSGNEQIVIKIDQLMHRINQMERMQVQLQEIYEHQKLTIEHKYGSMLKKATETLEEYKWEIEDMKRILNRGSMMIDSGAKESKLELEIQNLTDNMKNQLVAFNKIQTTLKTAQEKLKKHKEKKEKNEEKLKKEKKKIKEKQEKLLEEKEAEAQELVAAAEIKYKNLINLERAKWDEEKFELKTTLVKPLMEKTNILESEKLKAENALKMLQQKQALSEEEYQDNLLKQFTLGYNQRKVETTKEVREFEIQTDITGTSRENYEKIEKNRQERLDALNKWHTTVLDHFLRKKFPDQETKEAEFEALEKTFMERYNNLPPIPIVYDLVNDHYVNIHQKLEESLQLRVREHDIRNREDILKEKIKIQQESEKKYESLTQFDLDIKERAAELSELAESNPFKCHTNYRFFSYHINQWEPKFKLALGTSSFLRLDIKKMDLEENKKMFQLLCAINKYTGSKSHIWFGNELNRMYNKGHHYSTLKLVDRIARAQDTYLTWFGKNAAKGYNDLKDDLITEDSTVYADLLRSIGNTNIARNFIKTDNIKPIDDDFNFEGEARLGKFENYDTHETREIRETHGTHE